MKWECIKFKYEQSTVNRFLMSTIKSSLLLLIDKRSYYTINERFIMIHDSCRIIKTEKNDNTQHTHWQNKLTLNTRVCNSDMRHVGILNVNNLKRFTQIHVYIYLFM